MLAYVQGMQVEAEDRQLAVERVQQAAHQQPPALAFQAAPQQFQVGNYFRWPRIGLLIIRCMQAAAEPFADKFGIAPVSLAFRQESSLCCRTWKAVLICGQPQT